MLTVYKPALEDLWFKKMLMEDADTMSYNAAWGGCIPFPRQEWPAWYAAWMTCPEEQRYYRYLKEEETGQWVGEIAWRFDAGSQMTMCDIIVLARCRNRGYGTKGLELLCQAARENGIEVLYDEIAADNPSVQLFLENGFRIIERKEQSILVQKVL